MEIGNCCSLCLSEDCQNGDNLIWRDGMQLCKNCYEEYSRYEYIQHGMLINAIKLYRRQLACKIDKIQELEYRLRQEIEYIRDRTEDEINYSWEYKIKAKIEELEKGNKNTFIRGEKILVLQSLLEKE